MKKIFLDYDQKALDDQYEQRVWASNAEKIIRHYAVASDAVRSRIGEPRTERYGTSPAETLDIYGSGRKAFVFVHGGAWKRQSKRENAFAAEPIVAAGASYVALDFALLPTVTLPEMVDQVCRGIQWVYENLSREISLCGHSSGGHLAACALTRLNFIGKAMLVSGLYDLHPVRLSGRNDYVRLNEKLEHEYSPIRHLGKIPCPVTVGWAEHESAEFSRQSREFAKALRAPTIVGKGLNHFEIIETMSNPVSELGRAALAMLQ